MKKRTVQLFVACVLIIAAIAVLIYNFSIGRTVAYAASVVAVIGTIANLIVVLLRKNDNKE